MQTTAQVCGTARSRSSQGQQVIRRHASAKPNMHTLLEQTGSKPGLWSWHLIPTSCRLSEQLQGRTLQLSCNDQFDTRHHTQESRNLELYRKGTSGNVRLNKLNTAALLSKIYLDINFTTHCNDNIFLTLSQETVSVF